MRLATNPKQLPTTTGTLPSRFPSAIEVAMTGALRSAARLCELVDIERGHIGRQHVLQKDRNSGAGVRHRNAAAHGPRANHRGAVTAARGVSFDTLGPS